MFSKTLRDVEAYLEYLFSIGLPVGVELCREAPEKLSQALKKFGALDPEAKSLDISHNGRHIASVFYPDVPGAAAAAVPIGYMLEKLFEQYFEYDPAPDAYAKALVYIKDHFTEAINADVIAKNIGYSRSYFGYIFKKRHGIPVNKYILSLRLSKAAELLSGTSLSVSDVAEKSGFFDANYFSTVFKANFGMPPKQYRLNRSKDKIKT